MQHVFDVDGKRLVVVAVDLSGGGEPPLGDIPGFIEGIWAEMAPFIRLRTQVLYIRDMPRYTIEGTFPGGHAYVPNEAQVALPSWSTDQQLIHATIAHELHHVARWQNAGYGTTLGGAVASEGLATVYEELRSGWTPPWTTAPVSREAREAARAEWDSTDYDHRDWFFDGSHGKWAGYALGYELAKAARFSLEASLTERPGPG
jgi:hypothetical protein